MSPSSGPPVLSTRAIDFHVLEHVPQSQGGDGLEKWRKIGDHKEDL